MLMKLMPVVDFTNILLAHLHQFPCTKKSFTYISSTKKSLRKTFVRKSRIWNVGEIDSLSPEICDLTNPLAFERPILPIFVKPTRQGKSSKKIQKNKRIYARFTLDGWWNLFVSHHTHLTKEQIKLFIRARC